MSRPVQPLTALLTLRGGLHVRVRFLWMLMVHVTCSRRQRCQNKADENNQWQLPPSHGELERCTNIYFFYLHFHLNEYSLQVFTHLTLTIFTEYVKSSSHTNTFIPLILCVHALYSRFSFAVVALSFIMWKQVLTQIGNNNKMIY